MRDRSGVESSGDLAKLFSSTALQLRSVELGFSNLTQAELLSIRHLTLLRELCLMDIEGLTDKVLAELAPKLTSLETLELLSNEKVSHVGIIEFVNQPYRLSQIISHDNVIVRADAVVAAIAANPHLCRRLTKLLIKGCGEMSLRGVVNPETVQALASKCYQLKSLTLPKQPTPYPEDILRLLRWRSLAFGPI